MNKQRKHSRTVNQERKQEIVEGGGGILGLFRGRTFSWSHLSLKPDLSKEYMCLCLMFQEYLNDKYKKTEQRVNQMENHSAAICQVYKEQDLTRGVS